MQNNIGVVINYCTNDYKFIKHNIEQVSQFTKEIVVPVADCFYDGMPENTVLLAKTTKENPKAKFIKFKFDKKKKVEPYWLWRLRRILKLPLKSGSQYWICLARKIGFESLANKKIEYVLFLDADEIIDGRRFLNWLKNFPYRQYNASKFANYWYFREASCQATTWEDSPLLLRKEYLTEDCYFDYREREGMYQKVPGRKKRLVPGLDNKPMVHHYCWVRTKREMIRKVQTWGHNRDRNWVRLIKKEFSHPFKGTDFVQGYKYKIVKPFIDF